MTRNWLQPCSSRSNQPRNERFFPPPRGGRNRGHSRPRAVSANPPQTPKVPSPPLFRQGPLSLTVWLGQPTQPQPPKVPSRPLFRQGPISERSGCGSPPSPNRQRSHPGCASRSKHLRRLRLTAPALPIPERRSQKIRRITRQQRFFRNTQLVQRDLRRPSTDPRPQRRRIQRCFTTRQQRTDHPR